MRAILPGIPDLCSEGFIGVSRHLLNYSCVGSAHASPEPLLRTNSLLSLTIHLHRPTGPAPGLVKHKLKREAMFREQRKAKMVDQRKRRQARKEARAALGDKVRGRLAEK